MRGICAGVLFCGALAYAQTPRFEVASVKPAAPGARGMRCTGGPGTSDPGTLTCQNYSLSFLVMMAYDLRSFQLKAPAWMETARYEVIAKLPPGTTSREFQLMQQALLAERFGLRAHFEKQNMTVYEMSVAKGGSKLVEAKDSVSAKPEAHWRPPASGPPVRTMAHVIRKGDSIGDLTRFLADQLGHPVLDATTGLLGRYDYSLTFLMEPGGRAFGLAPSNGPANGPEPEFGTDLIEAVRQQLGLTLKTSRGDADVLVVDEAKLPTEN